LADKYEKKVSIVVSVYNVEKYLPQCLDSLTGQTYKNTEILLIDDGSTDRSGIICDNYAQRSKNVFVYHKENGGVSSARNAGICRATGEYLIFVDADDWIHEKMIETYMYFKEPDTVLLCRIVPNEEKIEKELLPYCSDSVIGYNCANFMEFFFQDYVNSPVNKLYSLELIRKYGICFPEEKSLGEDLLFNLEYFKHAPKKYLVINYPLYYYRENREGSLSTSYRNDLFEIQQELFSAIKNFLKDMSVWSPSNQSIYYGMYWDRLYLTARIYHVHERKYFQEKRLSEILKEPIWQEVWKECKKRKLLNWKRLLKAIHLKFIVY